MAFRSAALAARRQGCEWDYPSGFAHVDIVSAEDGPDNNGIGPLVDFLARNAQ